MSAPERLREALPRFVDALHRAARETGLTDAELMTALSFLGDVARADELVLLSDVLGLSALVDDQSHAGGPGTTSNVLGPFYMPDAPWIENPGSIVRQSTAGDRIGLTGRVTGGRSGDRLPGAVVDVWQAGADGRYSNEQAPGGDPWHLRGRQRTDAAGRYSIETVLPSHYTVKNDGPVGRLLAALGRHPWRPAHIHLRVTAEGHRPLVTQVYVAGSPYLDDDAIAGVRQELVRARADGRLTFDVALGD